MPSASETRWRLAESVVGLKMDYFTHMLSQSWSCWVGQGKSRDAGALPALACSLSISPREEEDHLVGLSVHRSENTNCCSESTRSSSVRHGGLLVTGKHTHHTEHALNLSMPTVSLWTFSRKGNILDYSVLKPVMEMEFVKWKLLFYLGNLKLTMIRFSLLSSRFVCEF